MFSSDVCCELAHFLPIDFQVKRVLTTGACAHSGQLQVGDRLVSINGYSLHGISLAECTKALRLPGVTDVFVQVLRHSPDWGLDGAQQNITKGEDVAEQTAGSGQSNANGSLHQADAGPPQVEQLLFSHKPVLAFGHGSFRDKEKHTLPRTSSLTAVVSSTDTETSGSEIEWLPEALALDSEGQLQSSLEHMRHTGSPLHVAEQSTEMNPSANKVVLKAEVHNTDDSSSGLSDTSTIVMEESERPPQLPSTLPPEHPPPSSPVLPEEGPATKTVVRAGPGLLADIKVDAMSDDIPVTNIDDLLSLDSESTCSDNTAEIPQTTPPAGPKSGTQTLSNAYSVLQHQDSSLSSASSGSEVNPLGPSPLTPVDFHLALVNPFEELEREYSEDSALESQLSVSSLDHEAGFKKTLQVQGNAMGGVGIDSDHRNHLEDLTTGGETKQDRPDVIPPVQLPAAPWGLKAEATSNRHGTLNSRSTIPKGDKDFNTPSINWTTEKRPVSEENITTIDPDVLKGHMTTPTPPKISEPGHVQEISVTLPTKSPPPLPFFPSLGGDTDSQGGTIDKLRDGSSHTSKEYVSPFGATAKSFKRRDEASKASDMMDPQLIMNRASSPNFESDVDLDKKSENAFGQKPWSARQRPPDNHLLPPPPPLLPLSPPPPLQSADTNHEVDGEETAVDTASEEVSKREPDNETRLDALPPITLIKSNLLSSGLTRPLTIDCGPDIDLDSKGKGPVYANTNLPSTRQTHIQEVRLDAVSTGYQAEDQGFDIMSLALPLSPEPTVNIFDDSATDLHQEEPSEFPNLLRDSAQ